MAGKTYQIFIAHSHGRRGRLWLDLLGLLYDQRYFKFEDNSVPEIRPISGRDKKLESDIETLIRKSDVVLVFTTQPSGWIEWELETAKKHGKRVIAIIPEGDRRVSSIVRSFARHIAPWDADAIVACIRGRPRSVKSPAGLHAIWTEIPSQASQNLGIRDLPPEDVLPRDVIPGRVGPTPPVPIAEIAPRTSEPLPSPPKQEIGLGANPGKRRGLLGWLIGRWASDRGKEGSAV